MPSIASVGRMSVSEIRATLADKEHGAIRYAIAPCVLFAKNLEIFLRFFATPGQAARKVPPPNRGTLTRRIGRTLERTTEHVDDHLQRQSRDRAYRHVSGRGEATRRVFEALRGASLFTAVT